MSLESLPLPAQITSGLERQAFAPEYLHALAAIQAEKYSQAYHILLALEKVDPGDTQVLFLLAWTAPNRTAAMRHFRHLCEVDPENVLAKDGLVWSQSEWTYVGRVSKTEHSNSLKVHAEAVRGLEPDKSPLGVTVRQIPTIFKAIPRVEEIPLPWILGFYLFAIAAAEWVTTFYNPQMGLVIHGSLLVLIFLHASMGAQAAGQKFLFALALAPLIRLMSLSMPLLEFQFSYWYAIIGIPLLLAAFLVFRLTGFNLAEIGLKPRLLPVQILIGVTGVGIGWMEYQILKPEPLVQNWDLQEVWIPALILLVFTGFLEEFIFRGLMQRASQGVMDKYGLLYISTLFAVLHIGYRSFTDFAFVLGVGLAFALVARQTRSIWGVTLAHGLTNIALFIIFPLM